MFRRLSFSVVLLAVALLTPASSLAAGPTHSETTFTYSLADALADYAATGDNYGDCGGFVLLIDYTVDRQVTTWPDRETRHVSYTGHFYSSADTSRSLVRDGNFNITFALDANGARTTVTREGLFEYTVIDGHRLVIHSGRDEMSFATGPISATPKAGDSLNQAICDALR